MSLGGCGDIDRGASIGGSGDRGPMRAAHIRRLGRGMGGDRLLLGPAGSIRGLADGLIPGL